jgi:hypothetical protein
METLEWGDKCSVNKGDVFGWITQTINTALED